jgi:hypothetical protein
VEGTNTPFTIARRDRALRSANDTSRDSLEIQDDRLAPQAYLVARSSRARSPPKLDNMGVPLSMIQL